MSARSPVTRLQGTSKIAWMENLIKEARLRGDWFLPFFFARLVATFTGPFCFYATKRTITQQVTTRLQTHTVESLLVPPFIVNSIVYAPYTISMMISPPVNQQGGNKEADAASNQIGLKDPLLIHRQHDDDYDDGDADQLKSMKRSSSKVKIRSKLRTMSSDNLRKATSLKMLKRSKSSYDHQSPTPDMKLGRRESVRDSVTRVLDLMSPTSSNKKKGTSLLKRKSNHHKSKHQNSTWGTLDTPDVSEELLLLEGDQATSPIPTSNRKSPLSSNTRSPVSLLKRASNIRKSMAISSTPTPTLPMTNEAFIASQQAELLALSPSPSLQSAITEFISPSSTTMKTSFETKSKWEKLEDHQEKGDDFSLMSGKSNNESFVSDDCTLDSTVEEFKGGLQFAPSAVSAYLVERSTNNHMDESSSALRRPSATVDDDPSRKAPAPAADADEPVMPASAAADETNTEAPKPNSESKGKRRSSNDTDKSDTSTTKKKPNKRPSNLLKPKKRKSSSKTKKSLNSSVLSSSKSMQESSSSSSLKMKSTKPKRAALDSSSKMKSASSMSSLNKKTTMGEKKLSVSSLDKEIMIGEKKSKRSIKYKKAASTKAKTTSTKRVTGEKAEESSFVTDPTSTATFTTEESVGAVVPTETSSEAMSNGSTSDLSIKSESDEQPPPKPLIRSSSRSSRSPRFRNNKHLIGQQTAVTVTPPPAMPARGRNSYSPSRSPKKELEDEKSLFTRPPTAPNARKSRSPKFRNNKRLLGHQQHQQRKEVTTETNDTPEAPADSRSLHDDEMMNDIMSSTPSLDISIKSDSAATAESKTPSSSPPRSPRSPRFRKERVVGAGVVPLALVVPRGTSPVRRTTKKSRARTLLEEQEKKAKKAIGRSKSTTAVDFEKLAKGRAATRKNRRKDSKRRGSMGSSNMSGEDGSGASARISRHVSAGSATLDIMRSPKGQTARKDKGYITSFLGSSGCSLEQLTATANAETTGK